MPGVAGVVGAHHVPVLLHVEHLGRDGCMAMRWTQWPTSASPSGRLLRVQASVDRFPGSRRRRSGTPRPPRWRRRSDPGRSGSSTIVCRHIPPAPGCQEGPELCVRRPGSSDQLLSAVGRAEQRRVLDAGVDGVGVSRGGLEVPDPGELPRVRRSVVPLVCAGLAGVAEVVADRVPRSLLRRRSVG